MYQTTCDTPRLYLFLIIHGGASVYLPSSFHIAFMTSTDLPHSLLLSYLKATHSPCRPICCIFSSSAFGHAPTWLLTQKSPMATPTASTAPSDTRRTQSVNPRSNSSTTSTTLVSHIELSTVLQYSCQQHTSHRRRRHSRPHHCRTPHRRPRCSCRRTGSRTKQTRRSTRRYAGGVPADARESGV